VLSSRRQRHVAEPEKSGKMMIQQGWLACSIEMTTSSPEAGFIV
jgi:hypothetical protein